MKNKPPKNVDGPQLGRKAFTKVEPFLYLLPALLLFGLFTYYPFIKTVVNSFFKCNSYGTPRSFAGLSNYIKVLTDKNFWQAVKNTLLFTAISVPISTIISLFLALLSNKPRKFSPIYETMYALPMAISASVCCMIFQLMYNPSLGILNRILGTNINWLTDPKWTMISISIISTWMNIGYNYIFLLSAVRSVPEEILESAELDGARGLRKVTRIIIPLISPNLFYVICHGIAGAMMMSSLILMLSSYAQNANVSTVISYMYDQSINSQNYNRGYPAAVLGFLLTFVFMWLSFKGEKRSVHYD